MDDCLSLDDPSVKYMSDAYPMELEMHEDEEVVTGVPSMDPITNGMEVMRMMIIELKSWRSTQTLENVQISGSS